MPGVDFPLVRQRITMQDVLQQCKRHRQPFLARGLGFGGCFFHP